MTQIQIKPKTNLVTQILITFNSCQNIPKLRTHVSPIIIVVVILSLLI